MKKNRFNSLSEGAKKIQAFIETPVCDRQVVVHNGEFHCDDVVAASLLRIVVGEFKVIRTRNPDYMVESPGRLIIDVGEGFFDHHGKAAGSVFAEAVGDNGEGCPDCGATKIATALDEMGLISIWGRLERELIAIAFQDNGLNYKIKPKTGFVHEFNSTWNENRALQDALFEQACNCAEQVLRRIIICDESDWDAKNLLNELPLNEEVVEVPAGINWWERLAIEESIAKFVVYYGDNDTWYLQCVPPSVNDRFNKRIPLPEAWTKRPRNQGDFVFCHIGRFIAGFKTREAAFNAAEEALKGDKA